MKGSGSIKISVCAVNEKTPLSIAHPYAYSSLDNDPSRLRWSLTPKKKSAFIISLLAFIFIAVALITLGTFQKSLKSVDDLPILGDSILNFGAPLTLSDPFSIHNPIENDFLSLERPESAKPGAILSIVKKEYRTLPTNAWCENLLLGTGITENNRVYQIPYVVDAIGPVHGIRTHPSRLLGSARVVTLSYDPENSLTLSTVEPLKQKYKVVGSGQKVIGRLFLALEWYPEYEDENKLDDKHDYKLQAHVARGSPYMSAQYFNSTPLIRAQRSLLHIPIIDGLIAVSELNCGHGIGNFGLPVLVNRHVELRFHASDMTWMVFFSEPVEVICASTPLDELSVVSPYFELRAVRPMREGMVRIALVNNCTTGLNPRYCEFGKARDQDPYKNLIIEHSNVFPTAAADIELEYPTIDDVNFHGDQQFNVRLNWRPEQMSSISGTLTVNNQVELLMIALPHHQALLNRIDGSTNQVVQVGCTPTLHGFGCPVKGGKWSLKDTLYPASFGTEYGPIAEMIPDIISSVKKDINFSIPLNYMKGAGDTYFSGKILTKLARILIIADVYRSQVTEEKFQAALDQLRRGVQVWIDGTAISPFVYDNDWGGLMNCGCDYSDSDYSCFNSFPNCPAIGSMTMNFGFSYYNDHHFHLGYHIYAAAVVSKYDHEWAKKYHQRVLFLIRDIANPSTDDPYFVSYRHNDWYLGFAWASGIVQLGGVPYLNGRNWESSSESTSAYEAIALYGDVMSKVFDGRKPEELELHKAALRIKNVGRMLMSINIRTAKTYYHVQAPGNNDTVRIYPKQYEGKAVGMMWSMMMELQTWFGSEVYKSYGIQLLPLTPISQQRDSKGWIQEMLPAFKTSCSASADCEKYGWSVLVYYCMAKIGEVKQAWEGVNALNDDVYISAGGNGHSRTNTLWIIATMLNYDRYA